MVTITHRNISAGNCFEPPKKCRVVRCLFQALGQWERSKKRAGDEQDPGPDVHFFSTRSRSWPARLYDRPLICLERSPALSPAEYHKIKTTWLDKMDCLVPRNGEFSLKVVYSRPIPFRSVEDCSWVALSRNGKLN